MCKLGLETAPPHLAIVKTTRPYPPQVVASFRTLSGLGFHELLAGVVESTRASCGDYLVPPMQQQQDRLEELDAIKVRGMQAVHCRAHTREGASGE